MELLGKIFVAVIALGTKVFNSVVVAQDGEASGLFLDPDNTTGGNIISLEENSGSGYQFHDAGLFAEDYRYVYTEQGNGQHNPCVFPFKYKNKMYYECTSIDFIQGKTWCATTSDYDKDQLWGQCMSEKQLSNCKDTIVLNGARLDCESWATMGECLINPLYADRYCPRSCGLCTYDGNAKGKACIFPFIYENEVYFKCLPYLKGFWCSTTDNYDHDKKWGYCFPQRFTDILQFIRRYMAYGECDDQDKECPLRAKRGECKTNPRVMKKMCPWTCHLCAPKQLINSKECRDYHNQCAAWVTEGDCLAKPVFMYAICRKSCRMCAYKNVRDSLIVRDLKTGCPKWAARGECETNQEYMLQNCKDSCRAGGIVNGVLCMDEYAHCRVWAREGYCEKNAVFLAKICSFSCKMCPAGPATMQ